MDNEKYLENIFDRPIAYHKALVPIAGVTGAVLLSQTIYWSKNPVAKKRGGWFYKSQKEWEDETGLTRREQETARKKLKKAGVIEEKLEGIPATLWYKVNWTALEYNLLHQTSMAETAKLDRQNTPNKNGGNSQTYNTETTTETTPIGKQSVTDTPPNPEFDAFKAKKLANKKRKALKEKYPDGVPPWVNPEKAVVVNEVPTVTITQEYRDYCTFISKDRKSKFLPKVEGQNLWNELIRDGYTPDDIRYASVVAYRTDDFWKENFYPEFFFRRTSKEGKAIDNVGKHLNKKADGDPDIMKIKMEQDHYKGHKYNPGCHICLEERDDELPNST